MLLFKVSVFIYNVSIYFRKWFYNQVWIWCIVGVIYIYIDVDLGIRMQLKVKYYVKMMGFMVVFMSLNRVMFKFQ